MQTIKKGTRYSQIAEYYRRMIDQKALAVGEKMPTENQICALFQVSRITVREAMISLSKPVRNEESLSPVCKTTKKTHGGEPCIFFCISFLVKPNQRSTTHFPFALFCNKNSV